MRALDRVLRACGCLWRGWEPSSLELKGKMGPPAWHQPRPRERQSEGLAPHEATLSEFQKVVAVYSNLEELDHRRWALPGDGRAGRRARRSPRAPKAAATSSPNPWGPCWAKAPLHQEPETRPLPARTRREAAAGQAPNWACPRPTAKVTAPPFPGHHRRRKRGARAGLASAGRGLGSHASSEQGWGPGCGRAGAGRVHRPGQSTKLGAARVQSRGAGAESAPSPRPRGRGRGLPDSRAPGGARRPRSLREPTTLGAAPRAEGTGPLLGREAAGRGRRRSPPGAAGRRQRLAPTATEVGPSEGGRRPGLVEPRGRSGPRKEPRSPTGTSTASGPQEGPTLPSLACSPSRTFQNQSTRSVAKPTPAGRETFGDGGTEPRKPSRLTGSQQSHHM